MLSKSECFNNRPGFLCSSLQPSRLWAPSMKACAWIRVSTNQGITKMRLPPQSSPVLVLAGTTFPPLPPQEDPKPHAPWGKSAFGAGAFMQHACVHTSTEPGGPCPQLVCVVWIGLYPWIEPRKRIGPHTF